jgi:hypothetical protein
MPVWSEFVDQAVLVRVAKAAVARMRKYVPDSVELVYDNYNALVVGFGPTERAAEAVLSIALYPRGVTLFFLQGARLYGCLRTPWVGRSTTTFAVSPGRIDTGRSQRS